MRIRKVGCVPSSPSSFHHHRLCIAPPPPPPDLVSSTTSHTPRSASPDLPTPTKKKSGKKPTRISSNTFMYSLCHHQNELPMLAHSPPPVMTSRINASICSNQPGMLVGSNNLSGCSSGTTSADTSDASSPSSSLSRRWCEEEKMVPMKKRRQSLERFVNRGLELQIKNKKSTATWGDVGGSNDVADNYYMIGRKKDVTVEEMMRCTKSNGLGWRCWRRRLEGCTRCSHHVKCGRIGYLKRKKMIESNGGGGDQDFKMGFKKRKRVMMISRILDRTVPLVAANSYPDTTAN